MDLRKIKKLIDLLEESNLAELEIKEGEEIVRLSRLPKGMVTTMANELARTNKSTALLGICAAGGLGAAAVLERV